MQAIVNAIQMVLAKISAFAAWILSAIKGVFLSGFVLVQDCFIWVLDSLLGLAATVLNGLDLGALSGNLFDWASLPGGIVTYLQLIGFAQAMEIIVAACIVRFTLQLIPFVRLGS